MNTKKGKGKSKSKRDTGESKAIIGIVLAAIMLASVFAGISASAIADNNNNSANESVGDSSVVGSEVGTNGAEGGTISVEIGSNSPTANIDNSTHENESVFQLRFTPADENIIINNLTIKQIGSIPAPENLTNISVWTDKDSTGKWNANDEITGYINESTTPSVTNDTNLTIELDSGSGLLVETVKDIIICINTTEFELGKTVQMQLTSLNATGEMSGLPAVQDWTTPAPITSNLLIGTGNLTVSKGANDVVNKTKVDAGKNESGIVIMQANFTAAIEDSNLKNVTLEWNGSANATKDIDTIYLVNDSDADGALNFSESGETIVTEKGNFSSSVELEFSPEQTVGIGENRTFLVVVNTTKTFWSGETLAVNITDFNATGDESECIVSKEGTTLASNHTIGRAKIKVELGDNQPVYSYIPAGMNQTNLEITQFNFTVTAGEVNITHIRLQANSTLDPTDSADANNTWPRIWWDKNNDGYITHLINQSESDTTLNTTGNFNLSKELKPSGVNVVLNGNLTLGGTEENITTGYDSQRIIIAFNTTLDKPAASGNRTRIEINRTTTGYNYTAVDTTNNIAINDTSDYYVAKALTSNDAVASNPFWIDAHANSSTGGVKAGENTNLPVMLLNLTNMQEELKPTLYIHSITVTENGTANETMISNVALAIDDGDGKYGSETIIASESFIRDNSSVTLTPATAIEIGSNYQSKYLLILVNTSDKFILGKTLQFNVSNPSLDCNATASGTAFGVTNQSTSKIAGNTSTAVGTISASLGASTPADGTVSADANATYLPLMQLNFTAGAPEDVNVTSLTVMWNGTGVSGANAASSIGVVNDTNGNGEIDWGLGETVINATAFSTNTSVHDLSEMANVTKSNTSSILIYVNTTATNLSSGYKLAINISDPSTDYSALGVNSTEEINDTSTTAISSNVQTVKSSGEIWVEQLPLVTDTIIKNETNADVVMLRLNLTAKGEKVNVTSMKIKSSGTINETGNVTGVALKTDEGPISDSKDFETNDGYVELTVSPALTIGKDASKVIDVIATISTGTLSAGDTIIVGLNNPATDLKAVGYWSGVPIQNTSTAALQNTTTVTGNISVDTGVNNTAAGPVTAMLQNKTAILQLNFSASHEAINITAINVSWVGTENATNGNITIVAYNDTNGTINGTWDANDIYLGEEDTFDVNATANVSFGTNLTVPSGNSTNMLICLNVTDGYDFTIGDELKINVTNYVASGNTSVKTITPVYGTPKVSNTLTGTGNITVVNGTNTPATQYILAGANTTVPVWQLNMSTNEENATLDDITVTFNGTADVADIGAVNLYCDENSNATVDGNDTHIASGTINSTTKMVTLATTTTAYVNKTMAAAKSFLVTVNTTSGFKDNETIAFNITPNTTADVKATGVESDIVIATNYTVPMNSSILTGYGSVDLYKGDTQSDISNTTTSENKSVMELNFSAPIGKVNITNITVTWNGNATKERLANISIWQDSNDDGTFSALDTLINQTAFEDGNKTIETLVAGGATANLTVENATSNVYIVVRIGTTELTEGETLGFDVNQTRGVGYNATCNETGHAPYSTENQTITGQISVTAAVIAPTLNLSVGWNLVSVPKELNETNDQAGELFELETGERVWYYNCSASAWVPESDQANYTIEPGYGYWVYKKTALGKTPVYKTYGVGETPPVITIELCVDWNMIGHLDTESTWVPEALTNLIKTDGYARYSKVLTYNESGWQTCSCYADGGVPYDSADFTELEPGIGYWILMKETGTYA